jgi:hypothetical protein
MDKLGEAMVSKNCQIDETYAYQAILMPHNVANYCAKHHPPQYKRKCQKGKSAHDEYYLTINIKIKRLHLRKKFQTYWHT